MGEVLFSLSPELHFPDQDHISALSCYFSKGSAFNERRHRRKRKKMCVCFFCILNECFLWVRHSRALYLDTVLPQLGCKPAGLFPRQEDGQARGHLVKTDILSSSEVHGPHTRTYHSCPLPTLCAHQYAPEAGHRCPGSCLSAPIELRVPLPHS